MRLAHKSKKQKGFTLVEILTTLGIISALLIVSYLVIPPFFERSRDAERKYHLDIVANALEDYRESTGCYPEDIPSCGESFSVDGRTLMDKVPCDPNEDTDYIYVSDGNDCSVWFQIYTNLERSEDPSIKRTNCDEGCGPECEYNYGISSDNKALETCKPPPTQYACTPSGECAAFDDPTISGCPVTFPDDPTCQNLCQRRGREAADYRCHDERGKRIPD